MCLAEQIGDGQNTHSNRRGAATVLSMEPKIGRFYPSNDASDIMEGEAGEAKRPGAEIARIWEEFPCFTDTLQNFNLKQLSLNNSSKMPFAVNHFPTELHIK